jgi:hypothetical protein
MSSNSSLIIETTLIIESPHEWHNNSCSSLYIIYYTDKIRSQILCHKSSSYCTYPAVCSPSRFVHPIISHSIAHHKGFVSLQSTIPFVAMDQGFLQSFYYEIFHIICHNPFRCTSFSSTHSSALFLALVQRTQKILFRAINPSIFH